MDKIDSGMVTQLIDQLERTSSLAVQSGPFLFAVLFLCFVPFLISFFYKRIFQSTSDPEIVRSLAADYKLYFRSSVVVGSLCTLLGAGWWIFNSYRYSETTQVVVKDLKGKVAELDKIIAGASFTIIGRIDGVNESDMRFENRLYEPQIFFTKSPFGKNSWVFVIVSKQPIAAQTIGDIPLFKMSEGGSEPIFLNAQLKLGNTSPFQNYKMQNSGPTVMFIPQTD